MQANDSLRTGRRTWRYALIALVLIHAFTARADASNECKVRYKWVSSTGSNQSAETYINLNSTKTLDKEGMLRVENLKSNPIKIYMKIGSAPEINREIDGDQCDPPGGLNYGPFHKLTKVKCLEPASSGPMTAAALITGMKIAGQPVVAIAAAVKSSFPATSGAEMAQLLESAGLGVVEVGTALKVVFNASASSVAGWLLDAGWGATTVAQVLKQLFNTSYSVVATIMKAEGMSAAVILEAMDEVAANLDEDDAAAEFKRLGGYGSVTLIQAFETVLSVEPAVAGAALLAVGYSPGDVVSAMNRRNALTVGAMERLLGVAHEVGGTIVSTTLSAFKRANATRSVVEQAMLAIRRWSRTEIQSLLDQAYGAASK
jgi:hypothetical protein